MIFWTYKIWTPDHAETVLGFFFFLFWKDQKFHTLIWTKPVSISATLFYIYLLLQKSGEGGAVAGGGTQWFMTRS